MAPFLVWWQLSLLKGFESKVGDRVNSAHQASQQAGLFSAGFLLDSVGLLGCLERAALLWVVAALSTCAWPGSKR